MIESTCPECGGPGVVVGSMGDEYDETVYDCPTNNCGDWYTMSPRRRAAINQAAALRRIKARSAARMSPEAYALRVARQHQGR